MFSNHVTTNGHSPVKMKKMKQEHIQGSVSLYTKRRQISEAEQKIKKEAKWVRPLPEMALRGGTQVDTGTHNILALSSIAGDAAPADQQFTRLRNFIQNSAEPYKTELKRVLFPMFVNVYLELLCNGHTPQAHKFHERHKSVVVEEESNGHLSFLTRLRAMESKAHVMADKDVMEFRDHRFCVQVSKEALEYVVRHLKCDDSMLILQILTQHLHVNVREMSNQPLELKTEPSPKAADAPKGDPASPESAKIEVDEKKDKDKLKDLQEICRRVSEGPQCLPSVCFYSNNFSQANAGVRCTAIVSPDLSLMSTGYDDSNIVIQKISPGPMSVKQPIYHPGRIVGGFEASTSGRLFVSKEDSWEETDAEASLVEVATLQGHNGAVYRTRFLSDINYLLSCSEDGTVRLWHLQQMVNMVCYQGHTMPVYDVDVSLATNYFVSGSGDNTARLWCIDRNFVLKTFIGHTYDVDCVKFHPNSNYVATGGDRTVRLWSLQDGRCMRVMHGHRGSILSLAFSPDGYLLASSGEDRKVRICDLRNGQLLKEFSGHTDTVTNLSFNQQGSLLASAGMDSCLRLWDTRRTELSKCTPSGAEGHSFPELRGAFPLKSAVFTHLHFAPHNVLHMAGKLVL